MGPEPLPDLVYVLLTSRDGPEERFGFVGRNEAIAVKAEAHVTSHKGGTFVPVQERVERDQAVDKRCHFGNEVGEQLGAREGDEGTGDSRLEGTGIGRSVQSPRFLDNAVMNHNQLE
jgi:hypothetical protein